MTRACPFENRSHKIFSIEPYKTKQTLERLNFETLYFFKANPTIDRLKYPNTCISYNCLNQLYRQDEIFRDC